MKILSIDVGIKNLAFCLLETSSEKNSVLKWDTINLTQQINTEAKCCEVEKKKQCNKPAKFTKNSKYYCLKHSKKQDFLIPTSQLKPAFLSKQKICELIKIADDYKISYTKPFKKTEMLSLINEYIHNKCFEPIETANASKIDLVTIGRNIQHNFDLILADYLLSIDKVIIENQISPIANRMKTIQGMIAQYFIMKNNDSKIDFVNASNKLKNISENEKDNKNEKNEKLKYSERKKLGIQQSLDFLSQPNYQDWTDFFKKHAKKDDLADSFLQGLWYINNKLDVK